MKKLNTVWLCLLLAVAICFGSCPLSAVADELTAMPAELEVHRTGGEDGEFEATVDGDELSLYVESTTQPVTAAYSGEYTDMYSQLNDRQKATYAVLSELSSAELLKAAQIEYNGKTYRRITAKVNGIVGKTLKGEISGGRFIPTGSSVATEREIYSDLCAAVVAKRYDDPSALWLKTLRYGYKMEQVDGGSVKITSVTFDFYLEYGEKEPAMTEEMLASAEKIAAQASTAADTYSKVKLVHDILNENNTYGDTENATAHTAYSALVFGDAYEPVCEGYAKAFKLICDKMNIPCVLVSSKTHMWNAVKMDDDEWYYVDLTWDDSNNEPSYDYFLSGSQTEVGGVAFSKQSDHITQNPYEPYYLESEYLNEVVLSFPTVSANKYEYIGKDHVVKPQTFVDVKRDSWYYEAVEEVAELGLFEGDVNGRFLPNKKITRAEFAKVMAKTMGVNLDLYKESECNFTDVSSDSWYYSAAVWAAESGLMKGYANGTFKPNAPISRQEMCVVLYNAMGGSAESDYTFSDDAEIAGWAREAVYACKAKGLVQGDDNERFKPDDNTLRSHAATVFSKYSKL